MMDLIQLFKGLSDPVRLRLAHLLCQKGELCVCHLTGALSLPQSTVSRHLNIMKSCGLVEASRRGKWVYYKMKDGSEYHTAIFQLIHTYAMDNTQLQHDLTELKSIDC